MATETGTDAAFFFLTCGRLAAPAWAVRPGGRGRCAMPLTVGVVPTGGGRHLLVDCGFAAAELADPGAHFGLSGRLYRFLADPGAAQGSRPASIAEQLAARGIAPTSVTRIVATHLHLDHVGGFTEFPNAEVLATPAEIEAVNTRGRFAGYEHGKALRQAGRLVPLALTPAPRHGFPAHADVLGDGRVVALDAAGHTPGSLAVLLTSDDRSVLHAGDAAYDPIEYREGRQSLFSRFTAFRKDWLQATWGRLRDYEAAGGDVVLSHDPAAWARLTPDTAPASGAPGSR